MKKGWKNRNNRLAMMASNLLETVTKARFGGRDPFGDPVWRPRSRRPRGQEPLDVPLVFLGLRVDARPADVHHLRSPSEGSTVHGRGGGLDDSAWLCVVGLAWFWFWLVW